MKKWLIFLAFLAAVSTAKAQNHSVALTVAADTVAGVGCSAGTPCNALIWRAPGACPTTITASMLGSTFLPITPNVLNGTNVPTGQTFSYTDADQSLLTGQTYCWTATVIYASGTGGQSAPAPKGFQVTIAPQNPAAPSILGVQKS